MAPLAKVFEEKLGRPVQLMMNVASYEVKATRADSAPGRIILLVNPCFYIKEEGKGKGKDADGNKFRTNPENQGIPCFPCQDGRHLLQRCLRHMQGT